MIELKAYKTLLVAIWLGVLSWNYVAAGFRIDCGTNSGIGETRLHDTPDGFVERAVGIIVRGRNVEVTYQIGINPKTMRDVLGEWNCHEEFENDEELTHKFCDLLQGHILEGITVRCGEEKLKMAVKSVEPFARHHKTAVVILTAELPASESIKFDLSDSNFANLDGAVRYAIKANSNTIVTSSNVAPIVLRAERKELTGLPDTERMAACRVEAALKILPAKDK